ncbi:MAG: hypothetical protein KGV44_00860 [Flavobacteriaceae bacterium]|nr:hypothetical protein [Flavobacteriaceae bacterium]
MNDLEPKPFASDISDWVNVNIECTSAYFFMPFIESDSIKIAIEKIEEAIEFYNLTSREGFFSEVKDISIGFEKEIIEKMMQKFKISESFAQQILSMSIRDISRPDILKSRLDRLELLLKHIKAYQKEYNATFDW